MVWITNRHRCTYNQTSDAKMRFRADADRRVVETKGLPVVIEAVYDPDGGNAGFAGITIDPRIGLNLAQLNRWRTWPTNARSTASS